MREAGFLSWVAAVVFVGVAGCGSDSNQSDGGSGADASSSDGASGSDANTGADSGSMDSGGADSGGGDSGGFNPACTGTTNSACGKQQSIMRVVVKLGNGIPDTTGNVIITQSHYRLGQGSTGGVFHTSSSKMATVGANTPVEVVFDMCAGGEMWSEENCEFNLWAFVDKNGNKVLDSGEPAGRIIRDVSCKASGMQCFGIVLDCTTGMSCVTFQDPGACKCAMPGCNSPIKTCQ